MLPSKSITLDQILLNGLKQYGEYERKLVQFADDTLCILADIESVENLSDILKYFGKFSGLKLNI